VTDHPIRIGHLPDTPYFYPLVTGKEFLDFCIKAGNVECSDKDIYQLNELFNLPLNKFPSKYSLGMRKRLMVMALMLCPNDLYIMDELFNGLDIAGVIILKKWINKRKQEGSSFLLSSHMISALTDTCDIVSYIYQGRIIKTYLQGRITAEGIEQELSLHMFHNVQTFPESSRKETEQEEKVNNLKFAANPFARTNLIVTRA
jgi:ABC-2 type transport system ATP-binding protein